MDMLGIMYLIKSKELIETLADFFGRQEESHTRKSVLAILQRVSFIKKPRMQMISLGIISTIFQIFRNERDSLPEYSLQYLVALMMNLSLNK